MNAEYGWKSWLFTKDHKRIAILYIISITVMFFLGGIFAGLIRFELLTPQGDMVNSDTYNKFFTMHGIIMVFFFLIPSIPATLGNFFVPMMIGAKDLAFPRINLLSWYIYIIGAAIRPGTPVVMGGVDTGWTSLHSVQKQHVLEYFRYHLPLAACSSPGFSFHSYRTQISSSPFTKCALPTGMTWGRLPLFVWANYATSLIQVLGTPVVAITLALVGLERAFHIGIFDPAIGGDPILFQHMFWFYSHPAVYIMILPGMGVMSELVSCFSRKAVFGYSFVAASSIGIAVIGFLVWGHHMFVTGMSMYASLYFSLLSFLVAVPSAIKIFNWTATLFRGSISYATPMLYAFGFIGLFTIGGLTGLFLATLAVDVHVTDTYFVVAHFHYVMVGGMVLAYMGGLHFWWPKITGRMYPENWAKFAALLVFVGLNLTFFPQFIAGYLGQPRRYHAYAPEFQVYNVLSTAGATVLAVGYIIPFIYLVWSMKYGPPAGPNPWKAKGLEWETQSPPPTFNFDTPPVVTEEAYAYATRTRRSTVADHHGRRSRTQSEPASPFR